MKKSTYKNGVILTIIIALVIGLNLFFNAIRGIGNTTGGNSSPDYPYFITTEEMTVKNITIPKGTKLTYKKRFLKKGRQYKIMNEKKLTEIQLPEGETINWCGVPVYFIAKFYNSKMSGYSVYPDFSKLSDDKKTNFSELWKSCNNNLGVLVKNADDWSFNVNNIEDVSDCGVLYQRYYKDDKEQQKFLDELLDEMRKLK